MTFRHTILLLAAVALLSFVVGCGDDDGDTGNAAQTTTANADGDEGNGSEGDAAPDSDQSNTAGGESEFVDAANEVCKESSEQLQKEVSSFLQQTKGKQPAALASELVDDVVAPGLEAEIRKLRALDIPSGAEQEVEAIFVAMEKAIAGAEQNSLRFVRSQRPFASSERLADSYGIGSCGGL